MIIWLNGSFGVGKTTIAENLKSKIAKAILSFFSGIILNENSPIFLKKII